MNDLISQLPTAGFFTTVIFGGMAFMGIDPAAPRSWFRVGGAGVLAGVVLILSGLRIQ